MSKIVFKINGKQHAIEGQFGPEVSLNDYLRTVADLRGTKAMCHEGGCGACVVAVQAADPVTHEMKIFSVNSCLVSVLSCHNWEITTVEGIGNKVKGYHEIQSRLAKFNGTQCGYCTPGWVMAMYALTESKDKLTTKEVENSFASNICRCTGYRPIADAFKSFATDADQRLLDQLCDLEDLDMFKKCGIKCNHTCSHKKSKCELTGLFNFDAIKGKRKDSINLKADWDLLEDSESKMVVVDTGDHKWYKAYSLKDVFEAMGDGNDYKLIAGNTGQGVYRAADYPKRVIDIFNVPELKGFTIDVNLIIGAGMPLSEMMELFIRLSSTNSDFSYLKQFHEHMDLVAHIPVRNIGTIAGNLSLKHFKNDFQSDVFLIFESVGAMITIADSKKQNVISLLDFLKTDMRGKIIINVLLPPLSHCCFVKTYKIMPRAQNAHAAVNAAFMFKVNQATNHVEKARIVYGGIAPQFNHATKTEEVLVGKDLFAGETLKLALKALDKEIVPENMPPEPSVAYRKMLAVALFYKAILYLCPEDRVEKRLKSGGQVFKRDTSQGTQIFDTDKSLWPLNQPIPKIEALVQCSGEATYANDLPTQVDELFASFVTADVTAGSIIEGFDASEVLKLPGVTAFYAAKDIPGDNNFTPNNVPLQVDKEEILCSKIVKFYGQPCGIIVANRDKLAYRAAKLVKVKYSSISKENPLVNIDDVLKSPKKESRSVVNATVEPKDKGDDVKMVIYGEYKMESQYHFTMEPQTCVSRPTEDGLEVYASTQWMDLCNIAIAQALKVPVNSVNVIVRRLGGAYGAKITRAAQIACASALVSHLQRKTCRFVLPLTANMSIIGRRCACHSNIEVGVNKEGQIQYLKNTFYEDNGCSSNETMSPITALHFTNCYDSARWYIQACSVITDAPSHTWCRAPGSTEGVAMIEYIMERIAYNLKLDPIEVRLQNMRKENNPLPEMIDQLKKDATYNDRQDEVRKFNFEHRWRKRALSTVPLSYDLFYFGNYTSIVSIYHGDGSIVIIHGGIEMGQGMNTKVAQVCAHILGVPLAKISVKASSSFTSPNSMVTGGSIGSDCVPFATMKACEILQKRLKPIKEKMGNPSWLDLVKKAYESGIDLQASYMYSSKDGLQNYDIFGVAMLEVEIDMLTGNHNVIRVDILEDVGRSMSPTIDVGQIEGAFIMGLGYWTSEKLVYDKKTGELLTNRTWTYKPPGIKDIPADMRVYFRRNANNPGGVLQSKATGEPASCLAVVVTFAMREAVRACRLDAGYEDQWVDIPNPCTMENIFLACDHKLEHFTLKE